MLEYKSLDIETSDYVYEPAEDSFMAADFIEAYMNTLPGSVDVLDLGSGTGILGLIAAKTGKARSVVFADMNKNAVALSEANYNRNISMLPKACRCEFVQSDLFSSLDGRFDLIIFNAPYLRHSQLDMLSVQVAKSWDGGREGIEVSVKFLEGAKDHLKGDGKVILVSSSASNLGKLKGSMVAIGYKILQETKKHFFFEDIVVMLCSLE
ncbi:MAG: methyltransferase [Candidatus Micrarchaeaceae archaeon]